MTLKTLSVNVDVYVNDELASSLVEVSEKFEKLGYEKSIQDILKMALEFGVTHFANENLSILSRQADTLISRKENE